MLDFAEDTPHSWKTRESNPRPPCCKRGSKSNEAGCCNHSRLLSSRPVNGQLLQHRSTTRVGCRQKLEFSTRVGAANGCESIPEPRYYLLGGIVVGKDSRVQVSIALWRNLRCVLIPVSRAQPPGTFASINSCCRERWSQLEFFPRQPAVPS